MKTYFYDEHGKRTGHAEYTTPVEWLVGFLFGAVLAVDGVPILVAIIVMLSNWAFEAILEDLPHPMSTMQFHYRGRQIKIFREGGHYTIVIDERLRDGGWPRLTWATSAARMLVDSDLMPRIDPERTGELE